jgi:hypothetical protein
MFDIDDSAEETLFSRLPLILKHLARLDPFSEVATGE